MPIIRPTVSPVVRPVVSALSSGNLPWESGQGGAPGRVTGFKTWSTSDYFAGAADGEPKLTETFTSAMLVRIDAVPSAAQVVCGHGAASGTVGGHNHWCSAGAALTWSVVDVTATLKNAPTRTIVAGDVGKTVLVVGTYDGSAVRQYWAGAIVGTSTAAAGLGPQDTDVKTAIGVGINGSGTSAFAATSFTVIGWAASTTTVLDAAGAAALYTACKNENNIASFAGMTHRWQASDNAGVATPWTDDTGSIALTRTGTGVVAETFVPVWA